MEQQGHRKQEQERHKKEQGLRKKGQHRRHHQQVHQRCQIREEGLPGWQLSERRPCQGATHQRALPVMAGIATAPKLRKASGSASGTGAPMLMATKLAREIRATFILILFDFLMNLTGCSRAYAALCACWTSNNI